MRTDRPGYIKREVDYWCTAPIKGRLFFYPPDAPLQVWAVSIQPAGVIWAEAEVRKITECNVMVRYAGETARLDRRGLWLSWARWRGVMFVSSRTGRIAAKLDEIWQDRYGAAGAVLPSCRCRLPRPCSCSGFLPMPTTPSHSRGFGRPCTRGDPPRPGYGSPSYSQV